jgi:hypothetical protein
MFHRQEKSLEYGSLTLKSDVDYFMPQYHGEVTPCQIKNHVQRKFATPILYARVQTR